MTDPGDEDLIDEDEEMVIDDISKEKTELKQLVGIIYTSNVSYGLISAYVFTAH